MRHEEQAGKAGGHEQRSSRIAKRGIAGFARVSKFQRPARAGRFKLIVVGGVFTVDGVTAVVQYDLRDGLFARQIGKLFEIFLNVFSSEYQGIQRGGGSGRNLARRGLGGARPARDNQRSNERRGTPPFRASRAPETIA